jgi:Mg/Co/Ni transporter MgtE
MRGTRLGVTSVMHHASFEATTLRLQTLRRLLGRERQLRVFGAAATIGEVRWELGDTRAIAAIVDDNGVLAGTVSYSDLAAGEVDQRVGDVMDRSAPTALAELEVEDAWQLVRAHRADRVVVVSAKGELLGIVSINELATARARFG